jgi:hypothetical protein
MAFMPNGVKGSTGGKKRKSKKSNTPTPGNIIFTTADSQWFFEKNPRQGNESKRFRKLRSG